MKPSDERRLTWAHSVYGDKNSSEKDKRRAAAVIAKLDPEGFEDHHPAPFAYLEYE